MDLIARIDAWSRRTPDRFAHRSGTRHLTYAELAERSDRLAAYLSQTLADDRSPVAIVGHKEPEMLVAFIGCIKAGHPYVPLDISLPAQRIDDIIANARARITLTPEHVAAVVDRSHPGGQSTPLSPDDPFYIIFTSGSTGTPKGVPITLGCLIDFIAWMEDEQRFGAHEVFLNQVPYSFDVSIMDTYLSLVTGGTVVSLGRGHIENPGELYDALIESNVSVWVSTPSFVQMCVADRRLDRTTLPALRRFFLAGETLSPALAAQLHERFPEAAVWNMYGPTEATVVTTSVRIDRALLSRYPSLPIGYPKPGTRIEVVDESGHPVPPGTRGEIVIAGPNVSPGYINRPDANERAFFRVDGMSAYRSGDAGHFEDGLLFFDGRIDNQIKLHGYRIEPGDVEAHLMALPNVRDAVVLPKMKDGRAESLQAFVLLTVRGQGSDFEIGNALREQLAARLPAHMLPRRFRVLDTFPMTVNGKADRRKLAELR